MLRKRAGLKTLVLLLLNYLVEEMSLNIYQQLKLLLCLFDNRLKEPNMESYFF